ncbi:MAG: hypothetical protein SFX19_08750 [Alphaproteobacteria bacterium]|nr:hypothetical protein [Alphaproteobacteria bacterium]
MFGQIINYFSKDWEGRLMSHQALEGMKARVREMMLNQEEPDEKAFCELLQQKNEDLHRMPTWGEVVELFHQVYPNFGLDRNRKRGVHNAIVGITNLLNEAVEHDFNENLRSRVMRAVRARDIETRGDYLEDPPSQKALNAMAVTLRETISSTGDSLDTAVVRDVRAFFQSHGIKFTGSQGYSGDNTASSYNAMEQSLTEQQKQAAIGDKGIEIISRMLDSGRFAESGQDLSDAIGRSV